MNHTSNLLSRRHALWLMGGLVGGLTLHSCTQSTATPSGTSPILSGVNPWPGYAGHYVALKKDFFKQASINVQEVYFQSASETITATLANKVDVAWLTSGDAIQAFQKDPTLRMIFVVDYSNGSDGIIGRGIKSPADLKGKTVARENVLFENVLLQAYLAKGGLTEADITLKDMTAADAATAFAAKQVDAAVTYEPWMTKASKQGGGDIIFTTKDTNLIADVIVTRQKVIESRRSELQAYLRAIDKAVKLVNNGDTEALKIVAEKLAVSVEEAKTQLAGVKIFDIEMNKSMGFNPSNAKNVMKNFALNVKSGKEMKIVGETKIEDLYDDSIVKSL
jgi:NitT/TauT family transport system substrate-binding protein